MPETRGLFVIATPQCVGIITAFSPTVSGVKLALMAILAILAILQLLLVYHPVYL